MGYAATLTRNNQITIPKNIRELLGVKAGERIVFNTTRRDTIVLEREKTAEEVAGEIDTIIPDSARQKWMATNSGKTATEIRNEWIYGGGAEKEYAEDLRKSL